MKLCHKLDFGVKGFIIWKCFGKKDSFSHSGKFILYWVLGFWRKLWHFGEDWELFLKFAPGKIL